MKRVFDIGVSLVAGTLFIVPMALVSILVKLTSRGPIIYWSERVGRNNEIFLMPKFRTMRIDTPQLATHLLQDSRNWITPLGRVLRATSIDELPQIWSILKGDMSCVGPRPALFNQHDLMDLRTKAGVHRITPGLTGWAQINGRDEIEIVAKVKLDEHYLHNQSFVFDLEILFLTVIKVLRREGVRQADSAAAAPSIVSNTDRRAA